MTWEVSRHCWLHYQCNQTHTGDPHENDTLECRFPDESSFVYCAWYVKTTCEVTLFFCPARYKAIKMTNG